MVIDSLVTYESWDLQKPVIPERSRLYHLEPIGVGTPYVESLTGYVARLAQAHCVSTGILILTEVAPLIKEGYVFNSGKGGRDPIVSSGSSTRALNGTGLMAIALIQALEALTLRSDLRFLTMLTWADVVPSQGLLRPLKAWCPVCFEEWRVTEQVIYEPLLWSINAVTICLRHHLALCEQCPHCHQQLSPMTWRSRPGYCSKCGEWLGVSIDTESPDSKDLEADKLKWSNWLVDNIGDLIATAPRLSSPVPRVRIKKAIYAYMSQVPKGKLLAFAHLLGKSTAQVTGWYSGKTVPQFSTLLQICYRLGISLENFLIEELVATDSGTDSPRNQDRQQHQPRKHCSKFDSDRARPILQAALNESPPPPLKEIVRRLGKNSYGNVYYHFTDLSRAISSRYADYTKAKYLEEMQRGLEAVLDSDEYPPPSLREVSRRLKYSYQTLYSNFPDLCRSISGRYLSYRKATRMEWIEQLRQKIRNIALELHAKGVNPHDYNVKQLLPKPGYMRNKEAIAALREVRRELGLET